MFPIETDPCFNCSAMADLTHARKYLEPSKWERSRLSRVAWHVWPAAILVALIAFVCARMTMDPAGQACFDAAALFAPRGS